MLSLANCERIFQICLTSRLMFQWLLHTCTRSSPWLLCSSPCLDNQKTSHPLFKACLEEKRDTDRTIQRHLPRMALASVLISSPCSLFFSFFSAKNDIWFSTNFLTKWHRDAKRKSTVLFYFCFPFCILAPGDD